MEKLTSSSLETVDKAQLDVQYLVVLVIMWSTTRSVLSV